MISQATIAEIQSRIDVVDVVGEFVKLKKRGVNYLGHCPFHGEKTPSFTVSPSKEIYKCFGCGKSGNAITFLMEHEKYSYTEALRWLAQRYNITIEETAISDEQRQQMQVADSLYILNAFAQKYFSNQLLHTDEGKHIALTYLKERGFNDAIIDRFQIGYNPNLYNAFTTEALKNQYNEALLLKCGLAARSTKDNSLRDNYRGRIIFPIHNISGKIVGFGARVIGKADKAPKYINTPENEIYVKNRLLYGMYFARPAIDKQNECYLVEGYTDVTSLFQAGVENVVASGGTSLTIEQLRLIKKYTKNLTIIYDGDGAGIKAALRGLDLALEESLDVKLVLIPNGEDPDSFVKKIGAEAFRKFIDENKKDFIFFQLDILLKEAGNDITKKNDAVNKIAESISKINKAEDFTKQQEYIRQCATLMHIDEAGLIQLVNKYTINEISKQQKKQIDNAPVVASTTDSIVPQVDFFQQKDEAQERNLLRVLLEYGLEKWDEDLTIAQYIFTEIEGFPLENENYILVLEHYREQYNQGLSPTATQLAYIQNVALTEAIANITFFPYELSPRWAAMQKKVEVQTEEAIEKLETERIYAMKEDVSISILYFKLRKIKKMIHLNQQDIEAMTDDSFDIEKIKIHQELKEMEQAITKVLGAVVIK